MAPNKKAPCRWDGTGATAALNAQQISAPTVSQALQFLLPVLTPHRPAATVFTALVGIAFAGGGRHG